MKSIYQTEYFDVNVTYSRYLGKPNPRSEETSLILSIRYRIYLFCQQYLQSLSQWQNLPYSI